MKSKKPRFGFVLCERCEIRIIVGLDEKNVQYRSTDCKAEKMSDARPLISVCICTYRRPFLLEGLLEVLYTQLEFPGPTEIIVVDNDAQGSAENVVRKFANREPALRSFRVPVQNISLSRNKAVEEARGKWIAMIDDDEQPDPNWLVCLFRCAINLDADAVFGPVLPKFPKSAPRWIVDGRFFERPRHETGTAVLPSDTRTGNVLIKADIISGLPGPFDPDFGLSGGEDSRLFRNLLAEGKRLFWCDDATVEEIISEDRMTGRWLIKRWFRGGQTFAQSTLNPVVSESPKKFTKLVFYFRSMLLSLAATVMLFVTIPFGKREFFKWLKVLAIQAGKICPSSFFTYQEYEDKTRPTDSHLDD